MTERTLTQIIHECREHIEALHAAVAESRATRADIAARYPARRITLVPYGRRSEDVASPDQVEVTEPAVANSAA